MTLGDLDFKGAIEILGFCGAVLGSTWHLSEKITRIHSSVQTTRELFEIHAVADQANFARLERRMDALSDAAIRTLHPAE